MDIRKTVIVNFWEGNCMIRVSDFHQRFESREEAIFEAEKYVTEYAAGKSYVPGFPIIKMHRIATVFKGHIYTTDIDRFYTTQQRDDYPMFVGQPSKSIFLYTPKTLQHV